MPSFILNTINSFGFDRLFLLFIIYSFIGWMCEVIYVGIFAEHKFVNRGFLFGPICPIYGVGALVLMLLPVGLKHTSLHIFFSSMVFCTLIEYLSSWIMEKLFHAKWWDYSHLPLNINGRVCLLNSVLFGLLGMGIMKYIHPAFKNIILLLNNTAVQYISLILFVVFFIDFLVTIHGLVDFNEALARVKEFSESLKEHYEEEEWFNTENISTMLKSVKEKAIIDKTKFTSSLLKKVEKSLHFQGNVKRFFNKFPTIKSTKYAASVSFIRNRIKTDLELRKNKLK